ncbi:MAG: ATP-binding cassette domain-containing protein [Pseudomonadota bacterium]
MIEFRHVSIEVAGQSVVRDFTLEIAPGELHVLMGPNGSGKSSLLAGAMGLPGYRVTDGDILFEGRSIIGLTTDQRARLGLGLAFQRPPALEGVTFAALAEALGAEQILADRLAPLDLSGFDQRELNVGFSGGETKRSEILRLILQRPRMLMFDEPESGVDLEHVRTIGSVIRQAMQERDADSGPCSGLVITHTGLILDHVDPAMGHIMTDGRLIHSGDARALFQHIQAEGYSAPAA